MVIIGLSIGVALLILGLVFFRAEFAAPVAACLAGGAFIVPPYLREAVIYVYREKIEKIEAYLRGKAEHDLKKEAV
jgi:membrane-bound ClpP family serine protease